MKIIDEGLPQATDYFGILWTMLGIRDCIIVEHGAPGTITYTQMSMNAMNRRSVHRKIYSCGVDEDDVILGSDVKLAEAVRWVDKTLHPSLIAVVSTAITAVIGLDIRGFVQKMKQEISADLIPFPSGGFNGTYLSGIEESCRSLIDRYVKASDLVQSERIVNVLGPTCETFNSVSDITEIKRLLSGMGVSVQSVFPDGSSTVQIQEIPRASMNLVVRDVMIPAGDRIKNLAGVDYLYGLPMGIRGTIRWIQAVSAELSLPYPENLVKREITTHVYALPELMSRLQTYETLSCVISCPFEYAYGLARIVREDWELSVSAVILPETPKTMHYQSLFENLGITEISINPSDNQFSEIIRSHNPDIVFGNSYHLKLAKSVPIRIHAASPTPDLVSLFDGTPFVGFRGYAYLTQRLVNEINIHPEVFSS